MTKETILHYLKDRKAEFADKYGVSKIGVFGSFAKDEAKEDSDIDIFVEMKPDIFSMVHIKEAIESDLCAKVDLVRLRETMNLVLKNEILQKGIYA
jgi:uncharacterized protein